MIHQIERKGQDLGSGFPFLVYIDKSQSSLKDRIEERIEKDRKRHLDRLDDPSILSYPQKWEQTKYIPKPKTDFIQEQNRKEEVDYILKYHFGGGSGVELKRSTKKPLEFHTQIPNQVRGDRTSSNGFSNKSRRNVLNKLSCISQDRIPKDRIKMITLTYDGREHFEKKYTPRDCKKHLNSFLTRLRKHLEGRVGRYFYLWRCEPQVKRLLG